MPNTYGHYYVLQCMDYWGTTFARIGFTVDGTKAGTYTLVGPSYIGQASGFGPSYTGTRTGRDRPQGLGVGLALSPATATENWH